MKPEQESSRQAGTESIALPRKKPSRMPLDLERRGPTLRDQGKTPRLEL
jgi:hypothetical protein